MGPGPAVDAAADRDLVFVSYCRADLQWVQRFQVLLTPLLRRRRLRLWADTAIAGAQEWHPAIERAIGRSALALLLVSGDFLASDYIIDSELPALRAQGVPLAPVLIGSCLWDEVPELVTVQWLHDPGRDGPLNLDADHPGRRDERLVDVCRRLVGAVAGRAGGVARARPDRPSTEHIAAVPVGGQAGVLHGVPERPRGYVVRVELASLIASVVATETGGAIGVTAETTALGLHGQGGIGKSVLLAALGRDERIRTRFPDGIYWTTVGERADVLALQLDLLTRLGRVDVSPRTVAEATAELAATLGNRRVLLLVDDVWSDAAAHAFRVTGPHGRVVYTARDPRVLHGVGAHPCVLGFLSVAAARAVAAGVLGTAAAALPEAADRAIAEVDRLALAVALLAAAVRGGRSWDELAGELRRDSDVYGDHPYANTFKAMQIAVTALPPELRAALLGLAVFPRDTAVPVAAVLRYWAHVRGCGATDALRDLDQLAAANVLGHERGRIGFHDLQHDYLLLHAPTLATLHADLLDAYRALLPAGSRDAWWRLPPDEPYVWDHLVHHLRGAGEHRAVLATVTDPAFVTTRIATSGVYACESDLAAARGEVEQASSVVAWWQAWLGRHAHVLRGLVGAQPAAVASTVMVWLWAAPARPAVVDPDRLRPLLPPGHLVPRWGLPPPSNLLVRVLAGHPSPVGQLAWSPTGARLAAADDDWEVRIWDVAGGRTVATLVGHTSELKAVAWEPGGRQIHTVAEDWEVRSWDVTSGQTRVSTGCRPSAEDARRLLESHVEDEYETLALARLLGPGYTADDREEIGHVVAAAWASDADRLAVATDLGRVWIWRRSTARPTAVLVGDDVLALAWSPDGTRLATLGGDRDVVVWDPASGRTVAVLSSDRTDRGRRQKVTSLAWAPDSRHLAGTGFGRRVVTWDVLSRRIVSTRPEAVERDLVLAWSSQGRHLAGGGASGTAHVWDRRSGHLVASLRGHTECLLATAWSPDGHRLATAGRDREIRVWAPTTDRSPAVAGHTDPVVAVSWSPDGRELATVSSDGDVRILDGASGRPRDLVTSLHGQVAALAWSPDARRLATAGPYRVARVWDTASGRRVAAFTGHSAQVVSVDWCPDGTRLASAALDGEAHIWDARTGGLLVELVGHEAGVSCVAWSPDGRWLATAGLDGDARVWAALTGEPRAVLAGHADWLRAVAWSPDGRWLATAGGDRVLRIWDAAAGSEQDRLTGHAAGVVAVCWSPDGNAVASCGDDGVLLVQALDRGYVHRIQLETASCVAWSGSAVAVGRANSVAVFDVTRPLR